MPIEWGGFFDGLVGTVKPSSSSYSSASTPAVKATAEASSVILSCVGL